MILRSRPTSALAAFVIAWDMQPASRAVRAEKGQGGGAWPWPILTDQLTLFQARGAGYAHQITICPPPSGFSNLPPVL